MSARDEYALSQYQKGKEYTISGEFKEAMICFREAAKGFEALGNHVMYARTMNGLGIVYSNSNNELMAIDCYMRGLRYVKKYNLLGLANLFYNNIGAKYQELGDYKKALHFFELAEEDMLASGSEKPENATHYIVSNLNLGVVYWRIHDYLHAEMYLLKAKELMKRYNLYEYEFPVEIILSSLCYSMGRRGYVEEKLEMLVGRTKVRNNENMSEYTQDITILVELLRDMQEYDLMLEVIKCYEAYAKEIDNPLYMLTTTEFYMMYYQCLEDVDKYQDICVAHAQYYKDLKYISNQENVMALNMKIALQKAEENVEKAQKMSEEDSLTALKNRYALNAESKEAFGDCLENGKVLMVGMLDVDCFKKLNDKYGHLEGDQALKKLANILYEAVEGYGTVYRFGGDEFVIILTDITEAEGQRVAERIKSLVEEAHIENADSCILPILTVSHGYYLAVPDSDSSLVDFMDGADAALYQVKMNGKNDFLITGK